jgi:sterol desaturase/sphingolipid hydroxylase (fatty acid hydroxylase superfamily)
MAQKRYVSNKDESARLFQSGFLELFTHVHWTVPLLVFLPVVTYFLYQGGVNPYLTTSAVVGLYVAGIGVWTLTEYILHRYVFHYEPKSKIGQRLHFLLHGIHHDYPNDSLRLVMPPVVSIPLAMLFYFLFLGLLGETTVPAFFAGFITGYLCYDMIHYATHHAPMKGKTGLLLKHHHMKHHYQSDEFNFGVSSPLWDYVFRTYREKEASSEV